MEEIKNFSFDPARDDDHDYLAQQTEAVLRALNDRFIPVPVLLTPEEEEKKSVILYETSPNDNLYALAIRYEGEAVDYAVRAENTKVNTDIRWPALYTHLLLLDKNGHIDSFIRENMVPINTLLRDGLAAAKDHPRIIKMKLYLPKKWSLCLTSLDHPEVTDEDLRKPPVLCPEEFKLHDFDKFEIV